MKVVLFLYVLEQNNFCSLFSIHGKRLGGVTRVIVLHLLLNRMGLGGVDDSVLYVNSVRTLMVVVVMCVNVHFTTRVSHDSTICNVVPCNPISFRLSSFPVLMIMNGRV